MTSGGGGGLGLFSIVFVIAAAVYVILTYAA
jgi:hypothetical protein